MTKPTPMTAGEARALAAMLDKAVLTPEDTKRLRFKEALYRLADLIDQPEDRREAVRKIAEQLFSIRPDAKGVAVTFPKIIDEATDRILALTARRAKPLVWEEVNPSKCWLASNAIGPYWIRAYHTADGYFLQTPDGEEIDDLPTLEAAQAAAEQHWQNAYAEAGTEARRDEWQPIETAPRDGTEILILTPLGISQAWFSQGEWEKHHEYGKEYTGSLWVCLDDSASFEVEEYQDESGKAAFCDDPVKYWMPLPAPPYAEAGE